MSDGADVVVPAGLAGMRLDVAAAALRPDLTRSRVQRMLKAGALLLNGRSARPREAVAAGDRLSFLEWQADEPSSAPEDLPLDVIYEDDRILVVNKPQGMATHPAPGSPGGTLVNALRGRGVALSDEGGSLRPGIVHRLDKDTSGLLVVAKDSQAHLALARQLATRSLSRRYLAVVWGTPRWERARVEAPIGRHPSQRQKMAVVARGEGRDAVTEFDVLEALGPMTLLRARLQSGRTHQIRVHASYSGHPVVGDPLYGGERSREARTLPPRIAAALAALPGQALHAGYLALVHPGSGNTVSFEVAPPTPFLALLEALGSGQTPDRLLEALRQEP